MGIDGMGVIKMNLEETKVESKYNNYMKNTYIGNRYAKILEAIPS